MRAPVLARHQVLGHRARPRPGGADGRARPGSGLRLGDLARSGDRPDHGAARRRAASAHQDDRGPCPRRRAGGRQRLADHSVRQRARYRAHPRSRCRCGRDLGVRHRRAPAVGGESDLPALAGAALPGARRARHGAHPRDARRPRLRRVLRQSHARRRRVGTAHRPTLAKAKKRFGLDGERHALDLSQFRKPLAAVAAGQGDLFG